MRRIKAIGNGRGDFHAITGRELQLVELIGDTRKYERADGAEGDWARLMLPSWRAELAKVRGLL